MSNHIGIGVQPRQAQHRHRPQGPERAGRPAPSGRARRRRAPQHALRRGRPPRRRLRVTEEDQPRPHLLPHPRVRPRPATRLAAGTTRPGRRSRASTGWTAGSTTTARRSGPHVARRHRQRVPLRDRRVQALYHRDRTGEGQFVDTSIIYAQLLNASIGVDHADGKHKGDRPQRRPDAARLERAVPPVPVRRRDVAVRDRDRGVALAGTVRGDRA